MCPKGLQYHKTAVRMMIRVVPGCQPHLHKIDLVREHDVLLRNMANHCLCMESKTVICSTLEG